MINLESYIDDYQGMVDVREHKRVLSGMLRNDLIRYVMSGFIDEKILQMILLRLPLPKIYAVEDTEGKYTIIQGKEIVNTVAAIISHEDKYEPRYLVRRVLDCEVDFVTFRANMEKHMAAELMNLMGLQHE